MKIALGSDHRGIEVKQKIINILNEAGYETVDMGTYTAESVDYPDIAVKVCKSVIENGFNFGILVCDTGIGMSIAANKIKGIRAALCCNSFMAYRARLHNDANVLTLGTRHEDKEIQDIVTTFLTTAFEGGRHTGRLEKIKKLEEM